MRTLVALPPSPPPVCFSRPSLLLPPPPRSSARAHLSALQAPSPPLSDPASGVSHLRARLACVAALSVALLSASNASVSFASDTPYSDSQNKALQMGLLDGKIRPCPSAINPNCISTSSMNATFAIPWIIPPDSSEAATRKLLNAIQSTQKNPKVIKLEDTPTGTFLQVEVDGMFGRDAMEFLVKSDVVTYRSLAEKVIYVYPFTTPISDFGAQSKRMKVLEDELGWSVPRWDADY